MDLSTAEIPQVPDLAPPNSAAPGMRIQLLGGFRVAVGERPIPDVAWRQRRAATLLKLLAPQPGHRLHREQLAEALWPDHDPAAATGNLRHVLHAARRQTPGC